MCYFLIYASTYMVIYHSWVYLDGSVRLMILKSYVVQPEKTYTN